MSVTKRAITYCALALFATLTQVPFTNGKIDLNPAVLGLLSGAIFGFALCLAEIISAFNIRGVDHRLIREVALIPAIAGVGMPLSISAAAIVMELMAHGVVEGPVRGILDALAALIVASVLWSAVLVAILKVLGKTLKVSDWVKYSTLFIVITCLLLAIDQALIRHGSSSLPLWLFIAIEDCASALIIGLHAGTRSAPRQRITLE